MTTRAEQARRFNEGIAQGMSEAQALQYAGITNPDDFTFGFGNGQLEPAVIGPPRRANETIVPANISIDAGDDDDEPRFRTRPVSSQSTVTNQNTVTGGSVRTTRVTPTTYSDTPASSALQGEANRLDAAKQARSAELRAQGKTGAEVIRDPQYQALSRESQGFAAAAENQKARNQAGTVAVTTEPGSGTVNQQTPNSQFVTQETAGVDPEVNAQEANRFSTSGELPRSFAAGDVTDTGGVPTQSLADFEDPGFVPQTQPNEVTNDPQGNQFVFNEQGELVPADSSDADRIRQLEAEAQIDPYSSVENSGDPTLTDEEIDAIRADQQIEFGPDGLTTLSSAEAARQRSTLDRARAQAILQQQRKQANDGDWRVRLRLAPLAEYLYKSDNPGILQPLAITDGVVFPYTPQITTVYKATYNSYNLTHSNYRGYFYQGSQVEDIQINATFTAQDTAEANYLLAVIHFFRSVTKMFYGQDATSGAPPPLVFLQGLGAYQFNLAPCVVASFNYVLPADVDYIRAGSPNINGTNLLQRRDRQDLPTNPFSSAWTRINNVLKPQGIKKGAITSPPSPPTLGTNSPTYVPTKMEITIILHPMQSREQVSKQFSLKQYANGDLLKGGFW